MQDREGGAFNTFAPDDRIPYIYIRFSVLKFTFIYINIRLSV